MSSSNRGTAVAPLRLRAGATSRGESSGFQPRAAAASALRSSGGAYPQISGYAPERPFIMHLERVCRLIEMGQTFTVELHPHSDLPAQLRGRLVRRVGIHILDGGQVTLQTMDGQESIFLGLSLANYKRLWRCWQNGIPTDQARGAAAWR